MRIYCISTGIPSAFCGDLSRKEIQRRGDVYVYIAGSLWYAVISQHYGNNYMPTKKDFLRHYKENENKKNPRNGRKYLQIIHLMRDLHIQNINISRILHNKGRIINFKRATDLNRVFLKEDK